MTRAFCVTCRTMREVMDTYETDTGDSRWEVRVYTAMPLECGHDANDGGGTPRRQRPIHDRIIKDQLVGLQAAVAAVRAESETEGDAHGE